MQLQAAKGHRNNAICYRNTTSAPSVWSVKDMPRKSGRQILFYNDACFALSTHFTATPHLSVEWFLYFESEISPNEIFKHLKSLKTNLPNALQFLIKSFVCNYIPVISRFHDALCNFLLSASLCLCVTFWMFTQPKMVSHYIRMYMQVRVCVCVCWRKQDGERWCYWPTFKMPALHLSHLLEDNLAIDL